jgi:putative spermidine/putrescine transport system ATP-binding protein
LLRPEAIELAAAGEEDAGIIATVSQSYYSGSLIDYRLVLESGEALSVQTFPRSRFQPGDRVTVKVDSERFWVPGTIA